MSIHLFLLGYKALKCLEELDDKLCLGICHVTVGFDINIKNDYSNEIIKICQDKNIRYSERKDKNKTNAKFLIAIGWRWMIENNNESKIIVFHDSILPRYRGFNPLVTALINGDNEIGVTALWGSSEFDKGDILYQWVKQITYPIKIQSAIEIISQGYADLFKKIIIDISKEIELMGTPQNENLASYSVWRDNDDYYIDWNKSSEEIKRFVDAVSYPYQSAKTKFNFQDIFIEDVDIFIDLNIENRDVGKIILKKDNKPVIICGKGLLLINKVLDINGNEITFNNKFRIRFT